MCCMLFASVYMQFAHVHTIYYKVPYEHNKLTAFIDSLRLPHANVHVGYFSVCMGYIFFLCLDGHLVATDAVLK